MVNAPTGWAEIAAGLQAADAGWRCNIPAGWRQGRTAYGGLTAALMAEAAGRVGGALPPLRSGLVHFVGPVTEHPHVSAHILRQGRNVTSMAARVEVDGTCAATGNFAFGASRPSTVSQDHTAPEGPAPDACEPYTPEGIRDHVPAFFHRFDTRLVAGQRPLMGSEGLIRAWSRHVDPASRDGLTSLVCLADVLPPAAMPLMRTPAPVSSMTWIFNILTDTPQTEDGWWLVESRMTAGADGYTSQAMRIWNTAGELVVDGMQSITIFS